MLDIRAYIATLIAVFLSLGIGILLGTIVVDKGSIANQQKVLLESIRSDIKNALEDNRELKNEVKRKQRFENEVLPVMVENKLFGKKIVHVSSFYYDQNWAKAVKANVDLADGELLSLRLTSDVLSATSTAKNNLRSIITESFESGLHSVFVKILSQSIALPETSPGLAELSKAGLINTDADNEKLSSGIIITLNVDDKDKLDKIYKPLAESLKQYGLTVIVGVASGTEVSLIESFKNIGISTINNIDEVPGKISLINCLNGATGNFGNGPNTDSLMPSFQQAEQ